MLVICIHATGHDRLTEGMAYRITDCRPGGVYAIGHPDGEFVAETYRFVIVRTIYSAQIIPGWVYSLQDARRMGIIPGQTRVVDCPCGILPGTECEYHGA